MQRLYVALTDREYEMTLPASRMQMRKDLQVAGFFLEKENKKFWLTLTEESPPLEEVRQFMNAIKMYEIKVTKGNATKQN